MRMSRVCCFNKYYQWAVLVCCLKVSTLLCAATGQNGAGGSAVPLNEIRLFSTVFDTVQAKSLTPYSDTALFDAAINGMLQHIDPYAELLDSKAYNDLLAYTEQDIATVGITITPNVAANAVSVGKWKVAKVASASSAASAGIKTGDVLLKINGQSTDNLSARDIEQLLRGVQGNKLTLELKRVTGLKAKMLTASLVYNVPETDVVSSKYLNNEIYYIKIKAFQQQTPKLLKQQLAAVNNQTKGIIIDVRDNPGGVVESAIQSANYFLAKDSLIVMTQSRSEPAQNYYADAAQSLVTDKSLAVLINRHSASAAEIFAAALQDNERAVVYGQNSYGKAAIQKIMPMDDKHWLKLTVATYLTPKGKSIIGVGVKPDVEIAVEPTAEKDEVLDRAQSALILHIATAGNNAK